MQFQLLAVSAFDVGTMKLKSCSSPKLQLDEGIVRFSERAGKTCDSSVTGWGGGGRDLENGAISGVTSMAIRAINEQISRGRTTPAETLAYFPAHRCQMAPRFYVQKVCWTRRRRGATNDRYCGILSGTRDCRLNNLHFNGENVEKIKFLVLLADGLLSLNDSVKMLRYRDKRFKDHLSTAPFNAKVEEIIFLESNM